MKILVLCPLWFPISRNAVGGIETFTAQLISALKKKGCDITLIASGDSQTEARLVPVIPLNLFKQMEAGTAFEYIYYEQHQIHLALERAAEYDVVHSHLHYGGYMLSSVPGLQARVLHTIHTPIYNDLEWFVRQHPHLYLSTVSEFLAKKLWQQGAKNCHVIHNGIKVDEFDFYPQGGEDLFFIGRIEWSKGPDLAVQVAQRLNRPLTLAGPIIDQEFFNRTIKPHLNGNIQYIGMVNHQQKNELFGKAGCAILPSRCDETFGLVAIEAMACGTPVVSLPNGALPEVVEPGLTGYLGREEKDVAPLVKQALLLDRAAIRQRVSARFDVSIAAEKYYKLYERIAESSRKPQKR